MVEITRISGTDVLIIAGDVDIATRPRFEEAFEHVDPPVVVDLRPVNFFDSNGLHVLLERKESLGDGLRVVIGDGMVHKLFKLTGLDQMFHLYPDLHAALEDAR